MKPVTSLYVHFADYYHVRRAKLNFTSPADIARSLSNALKIAVLFSREVYFPASSLFESPDCRRVLQELPEFREHNVLKMAAGDTNVTEHLERKAAAYGVGSPRELMQAYQKRHRFSLPTYVEKKGSSTSEITRVWHEMLDDSEFLEQVRKKTGTPLPSGFERIWEDVPQNLGSRAFVPAHAASLLQAAGHIGALEDVVALPIERAYIDGYGVSLGAHVLTEVPYLSSSSLESSFANCRKLNYPDVLAGLASHRVAELLLAAPSSVLFEIACSAEWERFAAELLAPASGGDTAQLAAHLRSLLQARLMDDSRDSKNSQMDLVMESPTLDSGSKNDESRTFDAAILTALPIEFAALRHLIGNGDTVRVDGDPGSYWAGTFSAAGGDEKKVLIGLLHRMGNLSAAAAASNLLRSFGTVEHLLFCGIALGVPKPSDLGKHVRLGDVVVGDREGVIHIDHKTKLPHGEEQSRSNLPPPPAGMLRALNELETDSLLGESPWLQLIETAVVNGPRQGDYQLFARPNADTDVVLDIDGSQVAHPVDAGRQLNQPKLFRGKIGSSDSLVKDAEFRDAMAEKYNLRAMEMEGAGALEAAWTFGRSAMVVRGICDYGLGKNDIWHAYAALAAAAVSLCLVSKL
ncbi:hypothetical protein H9Q09_19585 [Aurantimonas sp. DM33-3]|uniref:phosphorylase family protein n=1 Tax=Aurantimonas sp. DM33-3 TaxID=2766955 RepID=UPI0016521AA2|nr:hypothetical protein [Aurantimonas sp. DM33-3]MBC6718390.1 hypothetical protein [Aurantimonas sp. DM33-3]